MNYWSYIKSKWKKFIDFLLINYGWYVDTLHTFTVQDTMFYRQSDVYRVAGTDDTFIIIYVVGNTKLVCAKANNLGEFILWCRDINHKRQKWLDGF